MLNGRVMMHLSGRAQLKLRRKKNRRQRFLSLNWMNGCRWAFGINKRW